MACCDTKMGDVMAEPSWKDRHMDIAMRGLASAKRKRRCLWPIRRIHHGYNGYGYATAPIRGWSLCWFEDVGLEIAHNNVFHDCTRTGVY